MVGYNQIKPDAQTSELFRFRINELALRLIARAPQLSQHQFSVRGTVLNQQELEGLQGVHDVSAIFGG